MSRAAIAGALLAIGLLGCSATADVRDSIADLRRGLRLYRAATCARGELGPEGPAAVTSLARELDRHLAELEARANR